MTYYKNNLEFLKIFGERTKLKPFSECCGIEYTINLMIKHPNWLYLQATYTQESMGLEDYFNNFPKGEFSIDKLNEIWQGRIINNYPIDTFSKEDL